MIVVVGWAGMNISETADLLIFSHIPALEFTQKGPKIEKNIQWMAVLWAKMTFLMWEVGGEWPNCLELKGKKEKYLLNNHLLQARYAEEHLWTLKLMNYSRRSLS